MKKHKDNTNKLETKNPFWERLQAIMLHFGVSNPNDLALNHLQYAAAEKINRLKEPGANPSFSIVADIVNKWPELNGNWLITGKGSMFLNQPPPAENGGSNPGDESSSLTHLMKIQISVMEGQKESAEQQKELLKTLNTAMARQNSILERQAKEVESKVRDVDNRTQKIETNLIEVLTGVESLSIRQDSVLKELRDNFSKQVSGEISPSPGGRKKAGGSDGAGDKQGRKSK